MRRIGLLTVGREIALAVSSQKVVAFSLRLELGGELLGRDSGVGHMADLLLRHRLIVLLHIEYLLSN